MTHTSTEQERAEFKLMRESFEKEIEKDYHKPREFGILNTIGDHYTNQHIEVAWDMWKRSWQAARGAPLVPKPDRCHLCSYQHGHAIGCERNPIDIALAAAQHPPDANHAEAKR